MTALSDRLFPLPDLRRTPLSLLRWWESRRGFYNRVVGATGLITLAGLFVLHPHRAELFAPGLGLAVLAYGVAANVCYTFGWLAELVATALWGRDAPDMGPLLFREGLVFSVILTLFPLLVVTLLVLARGILGLAS